MIFSVSVIDTNDRFLRKITIGQSPTEKNCTREVMIWRFSFILMGYKLSMAELIVSEEITF